MKKIIPILITVLLTAFIRCSIAELSDSNTAETTENTTISTSSDSLTVSYIDIGQGDSTLITTGETNILIDGGEIGEGSTVLALLNDYNITELDYVIATHPHSDHIGGLVDIFDDCIENNTIKINEVITCDLDDSVVPTTKIYTNFLEDIDELGVDFIIIEEKTSYSFDGCTLDITPSPFTNDDSLNNESLISVFTYGEMQFVFTGDAEMEEEAALAESGALDDIHATVYQCGHHGSSNASSEALLEKIQPEYAVISCGADNSYGHPHSTTLDRLSEYTDDILRTDLLGTITFTTDGESLEYTSEKG